MKDINVINLKENQLTCIPEFPSTTTLKVLYLDFNRLTTIDLENLKPLENLSTLSVRDNHLQILSDTILSFSQLTQLDVSNNDLHDLPNVLGLMPSLNKIEVEGNPIKKIRQNLLLGSVENLKKYLKSRIPEDQLPKEVSSVEPDEVVYRNAVQSGIIDYQNQNLKVVPEVFRERDVLTAGQILLNNNKISEIPNYFKYYNDLQVIMLHYNNFQSFPEILLTLPKLETIDLSYNYINDYSAIKRSFFYPCYETLKTINLNRNLLEEFPAFLYNCKNLTKIQLGWNKIKYIDNEKFKLLINLEILVLNDNHLTELPSEILCFEKLSTLNLENNDIKIIPYELGLCNSLKNLSLTGNPQKFVFTIFIN